MKNIIFKALAQSPTGGAGESSVGSIHDVQTLLESIVGWAQLFFYIIATLYIILAAWQYLQSDGNEEKVRAAKQRVIYSLVAIGIAVIAGGVVKMVKNFVG